MDRNQRDLQFVALPTAASVVHIRLLGLPPDALVPDEMRKALEDVAQSLASLTPIYIVEDPSRPAVRIPAAELVGGRFTRGAHGFVTRDGREYRQLFVQRRDMEAAISTLLERRAKPRAQRILVIDDDSDGASSLAALLKVMGHTAAYVTRPTEAVGFAKGFRPDIVFVDLTMAEVDGYQLAQLFRAESELRDVALVALTGHGLPEHRVRARKAGFDAHVLKPADPSLIDSILAQFDGR
jgi:CheY-like chemotaxis protein